jgi:DNA replication protein DnaC
MDSTATTARCEFCGRELDPIRVPLPNGEGEMLVGYRECDCPEATARREAELREERERERAAEREAFYRRLESAGVPKRYLEARHPLAKGMAEAVESGRSLYIWGANGTLKTTLASAIVRRLVYHGARALMVNSVDMLIEVQSTYGTPRAEADVLAKYSTRPVLVLDDLGKEQQTPWTIARLYSIVNARDGAMLPTVVTSNFDLGSLAERMAAVDESTARAIASRLAGSCETHAMGGGDRRLGDV